jgi:hypothetical protein
VGQTLFFVDSFSHYDNSGIPLKWDTAGGTLDTAVTRTGPQSLRITNLSSPTKTLDVSGYFVTGFAWQTSILNGETICTMTDTASGDVQIKLVQNADGSISAFTTPGNVLIASSVAGVLTTNVFWYIEIAGNLDTGVGATQLQVTVTSSPGGVATVVINGTGFVPSQVSWNELSFGGPAAPNHAWIADFYHQSIWDGTGAPLAVLGAPKMYGLNLPIADGLDHVGQNNVGKTVALDGTVPPWWSKVNEVPQSTLAPVLDTDNSPGGVGFVFCGQCFFFDVSSVPGGSQIAFIVLTQLYAAVAGSTGPNNCNFGGIVYRTGDPSNFWRGNGVFVINLSPGQSLPFLYVETVYPLNPIANNFAGAPWNLTDLTGPQAIQLGPYFAGAA